MKKPLLDETCQSNITIRVLVRRESRTGSTAKCTDDEQSRCASSQMASSQRSFFSTRKRLLLFLVMTFASIVAEGADGEDGNQEENNSTTEPLSLLDLSPAADNTEDRVEDSIYDALQGDAVCDSSDVKCRFEWQPPDSTIEMETIQTEEHDTKTTSTTETTNNTANVTNGATSECPADQKKNITIDKHWGSNPNILRMRDQLRESGAGYRQDNRRPPIFLMPGLASTRLVAWRFKACPQNPILSDIKVQENVWMNLNLLMQMTAIDGSCFVDCLSLGNNQTDSNNPATACKLRPEEGLDAISSLSPGGITPNIFVGGTNTVYAWFIQWLADNLGYDVGNIVGLPYDWRLSPDKMEQRDGFFTLTRRKLEAAVHTNGAPGIMIAHSMGNTIFRYFLAWLRIELQEEVYDKYVREAKRRAMPQDQQPPVPPRKPPLVLPSWLRNGVAVSEQDIIQAAANGTKHKQLWERSQNEGDANWYDWIERHIWTYVGLSAPLLGAVNPLRATISGENMGLPFSNEVARDMEKTFGSTHTISPVSSKMAFCDEWDVRDSWDEEPDPDLARQHADSRLLCLDDIMTEIETSLDNRFLKHYDPWKNHPTLQRLLLDRTDWGADFPMIRITKESCEVKEKVPCGKNSTIVISPMDVQTGKVFKTFSETWKEEGDPMGVKGEQLRESFWDTKVPNILNNTWERPLIKHVIMSYGVDIPTEVGYEYVKTERNNPKDAQNKFDGIPNLRKVLWETAGGKIQEEILDLPKPKIANIWNKKEQKRKVLDGRSAKFRSSGDGSVPYLSLAWAHTWLLHGIRARRVSLKRDGPANPLDEILISHRPEGGMEWVNGAPPKRLGIIPEEKKFEESNDTGTSHPHGTKYKPEMIRYHTQGTSRTTGIEYTTTVIEAVTVEHKETTRYVCGSRRPDSCSILSCRNYDILAAVFSDVLQYMHDDLSLLSDNET